MRSSGDTPLTRKLVIKTHNEKAVDDDQKEADDVSTNTQIAPHFPSVGKYSTRVLCQVLAHALIYIDLRERPGP